MNLRHLLVGVGTLALAAVIIAGAAQYPSEAGYGGVGPNFLPWVVGLALTVCGGWLCWEAASGGFRKFFVDGDEAADWRGFAFVSAGILLNAALITSLGFVLSCTLCYVLAVCGFRSSQGRLDLRPQALLRYAAIGVAVSAPVYWMFTKALAINLPGLTGSGWL